MRMADFYLYYAEAMNEAYGPDAKADDLKLTARAALNKVRLRAKCPNTPVEKEIRMSFVKSICGTES